MYLMSKNKTAPLCTFVLMSNTLVSIGIKASIYD